MEIPKGMRKILWLDSYTRIHQPLLKDKFVLTLYMRRCKAKGILKKDVLKDL
jgi:hypothetical protein